MSPVMSSTRGSTGLPCTFTSRNVAFSFEVQRAVSRPGTLTHGVSTVGPAAHGLASGPSRNALPVAARYACKSPLSPERLAGFTHAAAWPASGTFPNNVFGGGGRVGGDGGELKHHPCCVL